MRRPMKPFARWQKVLVSLSGGTGGHGSQRRRGMSGMRNGRRALPSTLLSAVLSAVLLAGCAGESAPAPARTSVAPQPAAACLTADEVRTGQVSFPSGDGSTLQGLVIGTGPVGVVLAHQSGADLCQWKPYAYALSRQGYRVLALNFSIHLPEDVTGARS